MPWCPHIPLPVVTPHLLAPTLGLWGPSRPVPQFPSTTMGHFMPQEATAHPGSRAERQEPDVPAGWPSARRATRNTSCIDGGAAIQRGEALPGGSPSHRCPPILSHRAGPPRPPDTDSIRMDTEQHEGRRGAGWERAAGSGGERLWGRGDGSPGLSASSAGLCLACTGDGGCSAGPLPRSPALGGLDPASSPADCPSAEPRRPRGGSRASPEGLKRASASASAGAGWGLSFGKTTGSGGRRMRRPCWPCRTARSRPACRCC